VNVYDTVSAVWLAPEERFMLEYSVPLSPVFIAKCHEIFDKF
jgi:hypothetical protein